METPTVWWAYAAGRVRRERGLATTPKSRAVPCITSRQRAECRSWVNVSSISVAGNRGPSQAHHLERSRPPLRSMGRS